MWLLFKKSSYVQCCSTYVGPVYEKTCHDMPWLHCSLMAMAQNDGLQILLLERPEIPSAELTW